MSGPGPSGYTWTGFTPPGGTFTLNGWYFDADFWNNQGTGGVFYPHTLAGNTINFPDYGTPYTVILPVGVQYYDSYYVPPENGMPGYTLSPDEGVAAMSVPSDVTIEVSFLPNGTGSGTNQGTLLVDQASLIAGTVNNSGTVNVVDLTSDQISQNLVEAGNDGASLSDYDAVTLGYGTGQIVVVGSLTFDGGGVVNLNASPTQAAILNFDDTQVNEIVNDPSSPSVQTVAGFAAANDFGTPTTIGTLTNVDNTITGTGIIGNGPNPADGWQLAIDNQSAGTIVAGPGDYLTLDTGSQTITNDGSLSASSDAVLEENGVLFINSPVDNTGTISATSGGTVDLAANVNASQAELGEIKSDGLNSTINVEGITVGADLIETLNGGTLFVGGGDDDSVINALTFDNAATTTVTGLLQLKADTFTNSGTMQVHGFDDGDVNSPALLYLDGYSGNSLANSGTLEINNDATLNLQSDIDNTGTIELNNGDLGSELEISGSVTLSGGGALELSNTYSIFGGQIASDGNPASLNDADNLITGGGTIGDADLTLTVGSAATIEANNASLPLILNTGSNAIQNHGTLQVDDGSTMDLKSDVFNAGTIELDGSGDGSDLQISGAVTLSGGGNVTLSDDSENTIASHGKTTSLDIKNNTVSGAGMIGNSKMTLTVGSAGTIEASDATALILSTGSNAIVNHGTLQIDDSAVMDLQSSVQNSGTIELDSAGSTTALQITGSVQTSGGGIITLTDETGNQIVSDGNAASLNDQDNTISGAGTIGDDNLTLTLGATASIDANGSNALTIDTGSNAVVNNGLMEATDTGGLVIDDTTIDNATGTISAAAGGSTVTLDSATVNGGTLTSVSGASIGTQESTTSILENGVTLSAGSTLNVVAGSDLELVGTFTDNGTVSVTGNASPLTSITLSGNVTLAGSGTLQMSEDARGDAQITGPSLTTSITIEGSGLIQTDVINTGTIDANDDSSPLILFRDAGSNAGTMEATAGGVLFLDHDTILNKGTIQASGSDSAVHLLQTTITNGTLGGAVHVLAGKPSILQSLTINASGFVTVQDGAQLELKGTIANQGKIAVAASGEIVISGAVSLAGGGHVVLWGTGATVASNGKAATLTNAETIRGSGTIGDSHLKLINNGLILADAGQTITIDTGTSAVTNNAVLKAAGSGAVLDVESALKDTGGKLVASDGGHVELAQSVIGGSASIKGAHSILELAGAATNLAVTFGAGAGATLQLDASSSFSGTISGFAMGDHIDLKALSIGPKDKLTWTENTAKTGGTLRVMAGGNVVKLTLSGQYVQADFTLTHDGTGGVLIGDSAVAPAGASLMNLAQTATFAIYQSGGAASWFAGTADSPSSGAPLGGFQLPADVGIGSIGALSEPLVAFAAGHGSLLHH